MRYINLKNKPVLLSVLIAGAVIYFAYSTSVSNVRTQKEGALGVINYKRNSITKTKLSTNTEETKKWESLLTKIGADEDQKAKTILTKDDLPEADTLTQIVARTLVEGYLPSSEGEEAPPIGEPEKIELNRKAVENVADVYLARVSPYSIIDLNIVSDDSIPAKKEYINKVAGILKKNFESETIDENGMSNEMSIVLAALESRNYSSLEDLRGPISNYRKTVSALTPVGVPRGYREFHAALLNIFSNSAYSLDSIREFEIDPLKGTLGFNLYIEQSRVSGELFGYLENKFTEDELVFNENEDGNFFYQYMDNI